MPRTARLIALRLEAFKAYASQSIEFTPLTVVIGRNGAGKTSVLQAIEFLGALVKDTLPHHLESRGWDYKDLPYLRNANKQFGFDALFEADSEVLRWEIRLEARRRVGIARELVTASDGTVLMSRQGRTMSRLDRASGNTEQVKQTLTSSWLATVDDTDRHRFPELALLAKWGRGNRGYLALDPSRLRDPSRKAQQLGLNGESLAGVLRTLKDADDGSFDRVVRAVRRRYRPLRAVTVRQGSYGWNRLEISERWGSEEVTLNARQVSDGLLRLLAIATLAEAPDRPSVVMVDEIENGVHPHLLGGLMDMLEEIASRGIQVVLTTHSPVALNFVRSAHEVQLARRGSRGPAHLTQIADTPGYRDLGSHFDVGELWYNMGEDRLMRRPRRPKSVQ